MTKRFSWASSRRVIHQISQDSSRSDLFATTHPGTDGTTILSYIHHPVSRVVSHFVTCQLNQSIVLRSCADAPTPWPSIGWKGCRTVEDDPSSPACIDLARRWIEDCISSHPCCCTFKSPLPKRVVDVGSEEVEPRLYLSQKDEIVPYTALSYCWGDFRHITTTKDTLKQRLLGIPISVLPKTFNDAIALTRRLGVRYIWIDSLCIIQDDNLDWVLSLHFWTLSSRR